MAINIRNELSTPRNEHYSLLWTIWSVTALAMLSYALYATHLGTEYPANPDVSQYTRSSDAGTL